MNHFTFKKYLDLYWEEEGLFTHDSYWQALPVDPVTCALHIKSEVTLVGLPYFVQVFQSLCPKLLTSPCDEIIANWIKQNEGAQYTKGTILPFPVEMPFGVALTGERLALNLLQRATSVGTLTAQFVKKAGPMQIKILDTRKTTPGLRYLEKYAVARAGGYNHRHSQTDQWMIKDNHKSFFGGVEKAIEFFENQRCFYQPFVLEVHSLEELQAAIKLNVNHVMLDNFSNEMIQAAIKIKPANDQMTYEISGGVRLENIDQFLIKGIDAISLGALTNNPPPVDLSFKFQKKAGHGE